MSEGYGYDPYGQHPEQQPRFLGYDAYGQPVYGYETGDPHAAQGGQHGGQAPQQHGGQAPQQPAQPGYGHQDPYTQQQPGQQDYAYDAYQRQQHGYSQDPQDYQRQEPVPHQAAAPQRERYGQPQPEHLEVPDRPQPGTAATPESDQADDYGTDQFAFVEEPTDESEDVIDWLKFSESRTERREEARRRGRNRVVSLVVALVLVAAGGIGYLWYAGKLPGLGATSGGAATAAGQQRDVIVVHLRSLDSGGSSTALLVDNDDAKRGDTVLIPNNLAVSTEDGSTTTLAKSVKDQGTAPTRDALGTLLGADIKGSWRLDTPYLENLVELVGGITVDANATVPGKKKGDKPLVHRGRAQDLDGRAAVAYATYRGTGEPQAKQLQRFGEVMQQTLRKLSTDPSTATKTVQSLGQIPDPSLPEPELGASLAKLAKLAKADSYKTELLPVQTNGTLSGRTSDGLVKQVLGGTVKNTDPSAALRVKITNAGGDRGADDAASAALVNGGYTVVNGGAGSSRQARSQVTYAKDAQQTKARQVAKTLGLSAGSVHKGKGAANADVAVVLGRDYKG